jgi:hypothetical protein
VRRAELDSLFVFVFGKRVFSFWSEKWKSADAWLSALEYNLKKAKVRVSRGGDFDDWDIQVRSGLFSTSRGLLLIEEHGAGKQMLKLKCTTQYSFAGYFIASILCAISIIAALNGELLIGSAFWLMFTYAVYRFLMETAGCLNTLRSCFDALKTTEYEETIKEPWIENMQSEKAFDMVMEEMNGEAVVDESMSTMHSVARN